MDPAQLQPGYRLDRYELLCPLAYGGMASVWLARFGGRLGFERLVVVKMILPQYSQDPRFQEMFLDEARIASRIEHANVARILDIGEHAENPFLVMEWVDGDSLSKVMRAAEQKKVGVPPGIALRVCADAAAGLYAAHALKDPDGVALGVVHRDVSPQNILVANTGSTVLIDFGVAKARDRVSQETSAGQLKGKIRYMAPEQALAHEVDHRADVFSLGAILYELFAGKTPYDGPNEVATLHKLTSGQPPEPLPASVPASVRAVVTRALAHDPGERYATALELNLAIEAAMVEIGDPTNLAVVAQFTGQLLSERKAARTRAVKSALDAARARDAGAGPALATPGVPIPLAASTGSLPSASSVPSAELAEVPSSASSATLGSAAVEYGPGRDSMLDQGARRRRLVMAIALALSLAVGAVGVVLIVSTAILKHTAASSGASAAPPSAATVPPAAAPPASEAPSSTDAPAASTEAPAASTEATSEPEAAAPPIELTEPEPDAGAAAATKPVAPKAPVHHVKRPAPRPKATTKATASPAPKPTGRRDYGF